MTEKTISCLSYIVFLLLPFYYFNAANFQPVDIAVIALFCVLILSRQLNIFFLLRISNAYNSLFILFLYSIGCLAANYLIFGQVQTLFVILQTLYDMMFLMVCIFMIFYLYMHNTNQALYNRMLRYLLLGSIIPIAFIFSKSNIGLSRGLLSFNNPNQVGIYALLNISLLFYMNLYAYKNNLKINKWLSLILINIYLIFFIISASRAAFSILLLYILSYYVIFPVKQIRERPIVSSIIIALILAVPCWFLVNKLFVRIESVREHGLFTVNQLQSESYVRIFSGIGYNLSNLFYFLFGIGQYTNPLRPDGLEFHNNFIGIFNEIGLLGLMLYLMFNVCIIYSLLRQGILYLIPYLCYLEISSFHYIFRERINWLFLSALIFITVYGKLESINNKWLEEDYAGAIVEQ